MSEPLDARVLRQMVREAASEVQPEIDWEAAEDLLLARLDGPLSPLSQAMADGATAADEAEDPDEERHATSQGEHGPTATLHLPAISRLAVVDDADTSGTSTGGASRSSLTGGIPATDNEHSPSLTHEPPRRALRRGKTATGRSMHWGVVGGSLVLAACAALFLVGRARLFGPGDTRSPNEPTITAERWVDPVDVAMAPGLRNVRDLGALRAGDVVEATQGAVSFGQKDRVTWTLSPGSKILVRSGLDDGASTRHVVVLENGSIRADVARAAGGAFEPFVIEAGDTEVDTDERAVLSVTRSSIGIVVDVELGATTVGSHQDGSRKRMEAPVRAAVSLDGARDFRLLDPIEAAMRDEPKAPRETEAPREVVAPTLVAPPQPELARRESADAPRPVEHAPAPDAQPASPAEAPSAAKPADATLTESGIGSMLRACFTDVQTRRKAAEATDGSGSSGSEVTLSVRSTLSLIVDGEGSIRSAAFNPPLRPDLQSCAVGLLHKKVGGGGRTITVPIEISR